MLRDICVGKTREDALDTAREALKRQYAIQMKWQQPGENYDIDFDELIADPVQRWDTQTSGRVHPARPRRVRCGLYLVPRLLARSGSRKKPGRDKACWSGDPADRA